MANAGELHTTAQSARLSGLRVALVFPTFTDVDLASYKDNARFLGSIPPLSLAYVATELQRHGAKVMLLDCPTMGLRLPEAIEKVRSFRPDYVGFTLATVDWASSLLWMRNFKSTLGAKIVVGGVHMECYPAETMTHSCIDLGYVGYADLGFVDVLEAHAAGDSLEGLPGAAFRADDGTVVVNPPAPKDRDADKMGMPARELMPIDKHFSIVSTEQPFTAAMSNFGCPFGCEFCLLAGESVRWRSAKSVVDEMEYCVQELGIREMDFFDPIFSIRKERVMAICDDITRRGLHKKLIWSVRARTDAIDEACLDAMWAAGCRRIFYGIESGSDAILQRVDKRMKSTEHIGQVIRATKRRGYEVLAFVMIGNPLETEDTVAMTRRLLLDLPIDLVQVASLFPLPKTPIYRDLVAQTGVDFWREHVLHGTPVKPFPLLETDLSCDEIDRMVSRMYASFYFRPAFLKLAARRITKPITLKRGMRAAAGISRSLVRDLVSARA